MATGFSVKQSLLNAIALVGESLITRGQAAELFGINPLNFQVKVERGTIELPEGAAVELFGRTLYVKEALTKAVEAHDARQNARKNGGVKSSEQPTAEKIVKATATKKAETKAEEKPAPVETPAKGKGKTKQAAPEKAEVKAPEAPKGKAKTSGKTSTNGAAPAPEAPKQETGDGLDQLDIKALREMAKKVGVSGVGSVATVAARIRAKQAQPATAPATVSLEDLLKPN